MIKLNKSNNFRLISVFKSFFREHPPRKNRIQIKGSICGLKLEELEEPLMRDIRYLDKLVVELARRKQLASVLRG